jgi:hypothetical protein
MKLLTAAAAAALLTLTGCTLDDPGSTGMGSDLEQAAAQYAWDNTSDPDRRLLCSAVATYPREAYDRFQDGFQDPTYTYAEFVAWWTYKCDGINA